MKVNKKVNELIKRLELAGIPNAKQEALWLIEHALGVNSAGILARQNFSEHEITEIEALISRREAHEPLQYIICQADFYGRDFCVGPGVLIPRFDTETLICAVKKIFAPDEEFCFLDWGTGSGCIAITILLEFANSYAYMLENNPQAAEYAKINLERYNLTSRAKVISSLGIEKTEIFDAIISNPPYIPSGEIAGLNSEVRDYEPRSALDGGEDGMKFYAEISDIAIKSLRPGGCIILETGNAQQVQALKKFFVCTGEVLDSGNFPRCLILKRKE